MMTSIARDEERVRGPVDIGLHPFTRRIIEFRTSMGYPGPLFDFDPPAVPSRAAGASTRERLGEVVRLLEMVACPQPESAFEAYCLVFQLIVAVDNCHFGRFHPKAALSTRLGIPSPSSMLELAGSPRRVCIMLRELTLILGSCGSIEIRLRGAGDVCLFPPSARSANIPVLLLDTQGPFQAMRHHASTASATVAPRGASKRERMTYFLAALAQSPPASDQMEAMAGLNLLLESMERNHFGATPPPRDERLYSVLPFTVFASPALPHAAVLLSIGHAIAYYPDGRIEIHERDRADDIRAGDKLVAITPRRRVALVPALYSST